MSTVRDWEALEGVAWPLRLAETALYRLGLAAGLRPAGPAAAAWARAMESEADGTETATAAAMTLAQSPGEESRVARPRPGAAPSAGLGERLAAAARGLDLEVDALEAPYGEVPRLLAQAAPALLVWSSNDGQQRLLALLRGGRRPLLLGPAGQRLPVDPELLARAWCAPFERQVSDLVEPLVGSLGLSQKRSQAARRALHCEYLGPLAVGGAFALRLSPGRPLWQHARRARLLPLLGLFLLGSLGANSSAVLAWWPFAKGALASTLEPAWLLLWALLLLLGLPLRWLESFAQALFGIRLGALLRWRLMAGATRLAPQRVRGEGAGTLLGRAIDAELLEGFLLSGGFVLLGALLDTAIAAWVLAQGPAPAQSLTLLGLGLLALLAIVALFGRRAAALASARLHLTQDLTERLFGLRTRLVQEAPERRHWQEDLLLAQYLSKQRPVDASQLWLGGSLGLAWMAAGAWTLLGPLAEGQGDRLSLAMGLGGLLLATQALARLAQGLSQLAQCRVAWRQVQPLYAAAAETEPVGLPSNQLPGPALAAPPRAAPQGATANPAPPPASTPSPRPIPLLAARGLGFTHPGSPRPALAQVDFEIHSGDRVLIEGPSGGGKSTLVSLLTGWRTPTAGTLEFRGLSRDSWGAARWRAGVGAAPQFHENHVFGGTFGFNLQLSAPAARSLGDQPLEDALGAGADGGRSTSEALALCRALGLGPLLERMPAALRQPVGETGWQLSHGEKSRLYLARALLSRAPVVVLDESLAALDPLTASEVLATAARHARALVLVAHP
jgi:ATP-binding cassette subfamily B protein